MAIDYVSTASTTVASASSSTISSFAVSAGSDRALLVAISGKGSRTVTSVSWNGSENFTEVQYAASGSGFMAFYVLTNPTATTADIVVNLSGPSRHAISVVQYDGVDQVTNPVSRISFSTANSTSAQISFTSPTAVADQMLVFGINRVNAGPDTLGAPLASSNERTDVAATGGGTDTRLGVTDLISSGSGDAVGWGDWASDNQASIGIEIDPAVASLVINDGGHSHSAPNLLIVEIIPLVINETNQGHVVDNVNLLQAHALALNDSVSVHTVENMILVEGSAFPTGWGQKQKITIDSAKVSGSGAHTDLVVLVTLDHLDAEIVDAGSNSALNGGGDIRQVNTPRWLWSLPKTNHLCVPCVKNGSIRVFPVLYIMMLKVLMQQWQQLKPMLRKGL